MISRPQTLFFPITFAFVLIVAPAVAQNAEDTFRSANHSFEAGEFDQAVAKYRGLVEKGYTSPDLYYNLGVALEKAGSPGESVLWLRRARILDPTLPEARQNLEYLRNRIGFLEFGDSATQSFLRSIPPSSFRWAIAFFGWSGAILIISAFVFPQFREKRSWAITGAAVLAILAFSAHRIGTLREQRYAPEAFGIGVAENSKALTAPVDGAKAVIDLPPGSELRILQHSGPWVYVDVPGNVRGWVRSENVTALWPVPAPKSPPS